MKRDACSRKVRHSTHAAGCVVLKKIKNAQLNLYKCKKCGGWHLGKSRNPDRVQARIDQLLKR